MLVMIQRIWNSHTLLRGLENDSDTLQNAFSVSSKVKHILAL